MFPHLSGRDGKDGKDGKDGRDGRDGREGPAGPRGITGPRGMTSLFPEKMSLKCTMEVAKSQTGAYHFSNIPEHISH